MSEAKLREKQIAALLSAGDDALDEPTMLRVAEEDSGAGVMAPSGGCDGGGDGGGQPGFSLALGRV